MFSHLWVFGDPRPNPESRNGSRGPWNRSPGREVLEGVLIRPFRRKMIRFNYLPGRAGARAYGPKEMRSPNCQGVWAGQGPGLPPPASRGERRPERCLLKCQQVWPRPLPAAPHPACARCFISAFFFIKWRSLSASSHLAQRLRVTADFFPAVFAGMKCNFI